MGTITVNDAQQRQAEILTRLLTHRLTNSEAAGLLGISQRHLRRVRADFEANGIASLLHGNTGKSPPYKTCPQVVDKVVALAQQGGPYHGFNVSHLRDLLLERHEIVIGRSTLSRLLLQTGVRKQDKRAKQTRRHERRERKSAEGVLLQMDGSPHNWLEGRGPRLCLMGSIDDATGKVVYLRFHLTESQDAYLLMLRGIAVEYGLPMSVYHDKHTILRSPKQATIEDELAGTKPMSQVQRVLCELGVESITAQSPQAKGRIERLWKTLQDRLVKEMRLEQIGSEQEANTYLPAFMVRFNGQFGKPAADTQAAWIALPTDFDLAYAFSARTLRTVKADQTLSFDGQTLLLLGKPCRSGAKVSVCRVPEGDLFIYAGKTQMPFQVIQNKASAVPSAPLQVNTAVATTRTSGPVMKTKTPLRKNAGQRAWLYTTRT